MSETTLPDRLTLPALERRVLGVLIEKGLTTPEYYPLTLKAVQQGCNQRSNRDPVMSLEEETVEGALLRLKAAGWVECVRPLSGRADRWRQEVGKRLGLSATELGVLGELWLRGEQGEGELRARASRMRPIAGLDDLREILERLAAAAPPLVVRVSAAGQSRGVRWTHASDPETPGPVTRSPASPKIVRAEPPAPAAQDGSSSLSSLESLERRLAALEQRVADVETRLRQVGGDAPAQPAL